MYGILYSKYWIILFERIMYDKNLSMYHNIAYFPYCIVSYDLDDFPEESRSSTYILLNKAVSYICNELNTKRLNFKVCKTYIVTLYKCDRLFPFNQFQYDWAAMCEQRILL